MFGLLSNGMQDTVKTLPGRLLGTLEYSTKIRTSGDRTSGGPPVYQTTVKS